MDKKFVVVLGASAISMLVAADASFAMNKEYTSNATPTLETLTPGTAADYVMSEFTFQRSANVEVKLESSASVGGQAAASTAGVSATNTKKGNRSYGGTVGALSNPPKACQNTGTTPIADAPDPVGVTTCTF